MGGNGLGTIRHVFSDERSLPPLSNFNRPMRRACWFVALCWCCGTATAQWSSTEPEWPLWLSDAREWECLTLDEAALLQDLTVSGAITQQALAGLLGKSRVQAAWPCLSRLSSFRARLAMGLKSAPPRDKTQLSGRTGMLLPPGDSPAAHWRISMRHWGKGAAGLRLRLDRTPEGSLEHCASGFQPSRRGTWTFGALAPKLGQGLVHWSQSAFDDLGGMEGSHRVPLGVVYATARTRGLIDGIGWQRRSGHLSAHPWSLNWLVLGRVWMGHGWSLSCGGGGLVHWSLRLTEVAGQRWRGLGGVHGKGQHKGWSWRWALAFFKSGGVGRLSVLKSWTEQLEGHVMAVRQHPQHPAWATGERRATEPDEGSAIGWRIEAGLAWDDKSTGWMRWRLRKGMSPLETPQQRFSIRWALKGHRLTTLLDMEDHAEEGLLAIWSLRYRKEWPSEAWEGARWRIHMGAAGAGDVLGGVVGFQVRWEQPNGWVCSAGAGQSWGHPDAPVRYVPSWDGRPAQPFRQRNGLAFLRIQSPNGLWRWRCRFGMSSDQKPPLQRSFALQGFDVEFRLSQVPKRGL